MKVLVIGSGGLIGNRLCDILYYKYGCNIIPFDIKYNPSMDLCKIESHSILEKCVLDSDFVFFMAFNVGGSKYIGEFSNTLNIINSNIKILHNVFAALEKNPRPFIFASSQMSNMLHSPYGCLKRIGEHYTNALGGINVRFWNVYGKEEYGVKSHVINDFIWQAKNNHVIKMLTDGKEQRQFLHVDDCCEALKNLMISYNKLDKTKYYDITSFKWITIEEIASIVSKYTLCELISGEKTDTSQCGILNEPSIHVLKHWMGPKITLEDGVVGLIDDEFN